MIIATNVTREYLGGITRTNLNFMNSFPGKGGGVVGIELNARQHMRGPSIFNHLSSEWFHHHIVNIHDTNLHKNIDTSKNLKDLEKKYRPIIKIIKDVLVQEKVDVVFLNGTYYIPWLISIAAHELKLPTVLRYAGVYTKETEQAKPKARDFFCKIEKSFQTRVSHFIFPSRLCKEFVETEIVRKPIKNTFIIPNPLSVPEASTVFKTVERRIAAVGRWDRIKNFETFFKVHTLLLKKGWKHEATFVTGDAKIKSFPKSINRLSSMTHKELLEFYKSQGLIVCPSLFETFGNVPMEAVCMGVPVLVSDNMGCAEILRSAGLENMVISFDDIDAVSDRIKKLCGQVILPKQINNLRRILDPHVTSVEIISVLRSAILCKKKNSDLQ